MTKDEAFKIIKEYQCMTCPYDAHNVDECDIRGCDYRDAVKVIMSGALIGIASRKCEDEDDDIPCGGCKYVYICVGIDPDNDNCPLLFPKEDIIQKMDEKVKEREQNNKTEYEKYIPLNVNKAKEICCEDCDDCEYLDGDCCRLIYEEKEKMDNGV